MNANPSSRGYKEGGGSQGSPHGSVFLGCWPLAPVRQDLEDALGTLLQPVPPQGSSKLLPSIRPPAAVCTQSYSGLPKGSLFLIHSFLCFLAHSVPLLLVSSGGRGEGQGTSSSQCPGLDKSGEAPADSGHSGSSGAAAH